MPNKGSPDKGIKLSLHNEVPQMPKPSSIRVPKDVKKPSPIKQTTGVTKSSLIQPAQANKPRIPFLWRGMKKADTVLHPLPVSKPRKISFLKLGRLSSAVLDDSNSDVDVSQFMLDQDECFDQGPLDQDIEVPNKDSSFKDLENEVPKNVETLEKEDAVVGHVSPTQDMASRSILTQHPGENYGVKLMLALESRCIPEVLEGVTVFRNDAWSVNNQQENKVVE